jgi:glycosyltransferase involved in cell wall biosynthesis
VRSDNLILFPNQSFESVPKNDMWISLRRKLEEFQPDVIFIYGYTLDIMRRAKSWADHHGVAIALISDSNHFDKKRYGILEFVKYLYVSRLDAAFVGGTSSSLYVQKLGISKERSILGYDVVDNDFFCEQAKINRVMATRIRQKWNLPENYFLFIGRLIREKNLYRLFDAYKAYVNSQPRAWSLVICGDGPDRQELRDFVAKLPKNLSEKVLFYGHIKQPEIIDFYSCASCFVLPSVSETWGLVVNEAMSCGLPVLVSNRCGCAADLVANHSNGWTFDPLDCSVITDLMMKVSTLSPSARMEMGLHSEEIIARWGLNTFAQNAIECAKVAIDHRNHNHVNGNGRY